MSLLTRLFGKPEKEIKEITTEQADNRPPSKPEPTGTALHQSDESTRITQKKPGSELTALELADKQEWEVKTLPVWKAGDVILDTYEVEDVISGGMGHVYIANHNKWNVKLAIKSPNEMMLSQRDFFARVLREADSWTELGLHPNIAYCYYVRNIEDVPHIFIEYVDGGNLRQWIEDGKCIDYRTSLDLAIQFCHGMEHAHSKGMIHRDIKPENVLMTKDGILKITDFGLVRTGSSHLTHDNIDNQKMDPQDPKLTKFGTFMGTQGYMAPEQAEQAHDVNERADIFSFGVCLYEMFCGNRPYAVTYGSRQEPPDPAVLSVTEDFPKNLSTVLVKTIQWEPSERYKSFNEIRQELIQIYENIFNEKSRNAEQSQADLKADGLNNRALSYLELGQEEEAIGAFEAALEADPHHLETTFNYGYFRWYRGSPYREVLESPMANLETTHISNPDYWRFLVWLHFERGDISAIEEIQKSEQAVTDPEFVKAYGEPNKPVGRLVWEHQGHSAGISSVAISLDGRYALSASNDKTLRLWEIENLTEIRRFEGHSDMVTAVTFSPNGRYALSGSRDTSLRLWRVKTGETVRRFEGHSGFIRSVAFSPDGRFALSGSNDKTLRLWDIEGGIEVRRFVGHTGVVSTAAFSPDGRCALSASDDDSLRLWEVETGREVRGFKGYTKNIHSVAFSPDGRYVLSGNSNFKEPDQKTLRLWSVETGMEVRCFEGHKISVNSVAISCEGSYAVSGGGDNTIRIWEVATGREIRCFEGHTERIESVALSPDGRYVLSGGGFRTDFALRLWETFFPPIVQEYNHPYPILCTVKDFSQLASEKSAVSSLLGSAEQKMQNGLFRKAYYLIRQAQSTPGYERNREVLDLLTVCGMNGNAERVGQEGAWCLRVYEGHTGEVRTVALSPDNRYALSGGGYKKDFTLRLWDIDTANEMRQFKHSDYVQSAAFSPDGRYAISGEGISGFGGKEPAIRIWDIKTGREIRRFDGHTGGVESVAFSPDGLCALSGSADHTLRLWDIETGREIRCFEGDFGTVSSAVFCPNGRFVLSGCSNNHLHLSEVKTGQEIRCFERLSSRIESVAVSPDGLYALSGGRDSILRLWEIESGKELRCIKGHTSWVHSVAFSPDGRYALSGDGDATLRLWEIASGREVQCLEGHTSTIFSAVFSLDARYALSGSTDKTLRLWEFDWDWEFD